MKAVSIAAAALMALSMPTQAENASPASNVSRGTQDFINKAAITNMFEIQAARAAEEKASEKAYDDFARMIVADHKNLADELNSKASAIQGATVPSGLDQAHEQQLKNLKSVSGPAFERQFRAAQIEGHQLAIKTFQEYSQQGQDVALKSWAQASVPTLQKHLKDAQALPMPPAPRVGMVTPAKPGAATMGSAPTSDKDDAQRLVNEAVSVVKKMEADPQVANLIKDAKGIYIVPEFGRGALVVGARGGAGVMLANDNGRWSDPAFYDLGGISIGAQAGGSGGSVAFLLMSQGAVDAFKSGNHFSLNAGAGLSIVTYSANAQASWGKGDIVLWSKMAGAYIGATISVTDINWADDNNQSFYGKKVDISAILSGAATGARADELKGALAG